ncbi:rhodanese-like domain-containing protein [Vibrio sp.]|uniref:rhodanese-like domain-containing protein n=1 Tax=Vibrio sp. TaxID=678 RepID=UPI003D0CAF15
MFGFLRRNTNSVQLDPEMLAEAVLLDVRTPQEFAGNSIQGSLNIPLQNLYGFINQTKDKERALVVYCASGMRSSQAVELLKSVGFKNVHNAKTVKGALALCAGK